MPQSLSKVYVHFTFSTKNHEPFITSEVQDRLFQYLGGICTGLECTPVQIGGYKNHVHTQMKLVEEVKKESSKWIKTIDKQFSNFYWQDGYGIFSVNPAEKDVVIAYIKNQEEHHKTKSFQDEFRAFLKKYNVDYDERYVWD